MWAGYEHPVDQVVEDLLSCLDDPALALLQWNEAFGVVQVISNTIWYLCASAQDVTSECLLVTNAHAPYPSIITF